MHFLRKRFKKIRLNKNFIFYSSLLAMIIFSASLINSQVKVPQRVITMKVDVQNRINICEIDDGVEKRVFRKTFFGF